jgi:hypothetical protein
VLLLGRCRAMSRSAEPRSKACKIPPFTYVFRPPAMPQNEVRFRRSACSSAASRSACWLRRGDRGARSFSHTRRSHKPTELHPRNLRNGVADAAGTPLSLGQHSLVPSEHG